MNYTLTLLSLIFLLNTTAARQITPAGKAIKTQFLVIGTTAAGIGAGLQAAKSGVKTLIIDSTTVLGTDVEEVDSTFTLGLDGRYLHERKSGKTSQEILKQWLKARKELNLLTGLRVSSAVKRHDGWDLKLSNGQHILADWIFEDIGPQRVEFAPGKFIMNYDVSNTTDNWPGALYRTQVGTSRGNNMMNAYPLARFIRTKKENWMVIPAVGKSFSIGQVVGAMVANTVTNSAKDFDVRAVQKILLMEGLYFDSFNDLKLDDPDFMMFQRIFATGLLRPGHYSPGGTKADPEKTVNIKNIVNAFTDYYKSSVLWFEKHPMGTMNVAEALELLFIISHKSFDAQIQSEWNHELKFTSTFNSESAITRREFAMLLDTYLHPFDMKVDITGKLNIPGRTRR
ncbi:hypothetical protein [Pedobacter ginsengisoli]|uniref:hypothetical protein n=1 Tax=Pedobacter ginsengisoli TaxID=363852 RepID=UPI002550B783|nr:hypothetical protein [Pedobacter ginsengisoli]